MSTCEESSTIRRMEVRRVNPSADTATQVQTWSPTESRELLTVCSDLDHSFMETKHSGVVWDLVAERMKAKGYHRSSEQCRCKWENLVSRQIPEDPQTFKGRTREIPRKEEAGSSTRRTREEMGKAVEGLSRKKKRRLGSVKEVERDENEGRMGILELVEEIMKQQLRMEEEWLREHEAREEERRKMEIEWRRTMESLERERLMMENSWREREEQRRAREEERSERRDVLITLLLNKLLREGEGV